MKGFKIMACVICIGVSSFIITSCRDCISCKVRNQEGQVTKLYSDRCGTSDEIKSVEDECLAKANEVDGSECACEN